MSYLPKWLKDAEADMRCLCLSVELVGPDLEKMSAYIAKTVNERALFLVHIKELREALRDLHGASITAYGCPGGGDDDCGCIKCRIDRLLNRQEPPEIKEG